MTIETKAREWAEKNFWHNWPAETSIELKDTMERAYLAGAAEAVSSETDYRSLYEQEKALHEALQKYLSVIEKVDSSDPMEKVLWNHYQQLKQQYNGTINTSNT